MTELMDELNAGLATEAQRHRERHKGTPYYLGVLCASVANLCTAREPTHSESQRSFEPEILRRYAQLTPSRIADALGHRGGSKSR